MKLSHLTQMKAKKTQGFSLIELLVVVGVIAFMLVLSAPTMSAAFKGSRMNQGAEAVRNFMIQAHQASLKYNMPIEVRFYKYDDPETPETTEHILGYRMYVVKLDLKNPDPTSQKLLFVDPTRLGMDPEVSTAPLSITKLPPGVVLSTNVAQSSLLGPNVTQGKEPVKNVDPDNAAMEVDYFAFQYRADGTVNLPTDRKWFMTVLNRDDYLKGQEDTPGNYVCLQLNPYNGEVRWLQPN